MIDRAGFPHLFNSLGYSGCGYEIGVQAGNFSKHIRDNWHSGTLVLVDRWCHVSGYDDTCNVSDVEHDRLFQVVRDTFKGAPNVVIMRTTSLAAASAAPPQSADWVYLDADHSLAGIQADLDAWRPIVRPGGILAGHDYLDGRYFDSTFSVKTAVDAFAAKHSLTLHTTKEDRFASWYFLL